jgi:hypothetical protein
MDRARRWLLLTLASVLTSIGMTQRKLTRASIAVTSSGLTATASLSASYRPSTKADRWLVTWGDGHETSGLGRPPSSLSHVYATGGSYSLRLAIWDTAGGYSEDTAFVSVIVYTQPAAPSGGATDWFAGTTRTVTCSGDITTAMNTAIAASSSGDIVSISAGSCTCNRLSNMQNKNIKIMGAGSGSTIITADQGWWDGSNSYIEYTGSASPQFRITGLTLQSTTFASPILWVYADQSTTWRGAYLIDNCVFDFPSNGADGTLTFFGMIWGILSNCTITTNFESATIYSPYATSEIGSTIDDLKGAAHAAMAFTPGGLYQNYIEGCAFTGTSGSGAASIDTAYHGVRMVFRHNTVTNGALYSHWTSGNHWNQLWWEVYNNTFSCPTSTAPARLQGGGTGLIYNNTFTNCTGTNYINIGERRLAIDDGAPLNLCDGTHDWDGPGDTSAPGWPCLGQIGRDAGKTMAQIRAGTRQGSFPLYLWNNGPQAKCSDPSAGGSACDNSFTANNTEDGNYFKSTTHTNGDVDWSKTASQPSGAGTHTLTYTAAAYPHPCTQNFTQGCV